MMTPTSRGLGLLAGAPALLAVGFWYGYPEFALLGAAALGALVIAVGNSVWQPRLAVERVAEPDRVPRGEPSSLTLTVTNTSRLRSATLIAEDRCGARSVPVPVLRLRPHRQTTAAYPVPTERRGVVTVGPLRVTRRDPLGLVGLTRHQGGTVQVWVHPRVHQLSAVPAGVARSLDGRIDRVPHGSITFDTLREYVVGDEMRRVHWRTTARVGELMVREHLDTSLPRIVVLLDDRAVAHPQVVDGVAETFESACEAAASVVTAAVREDLAITLQLVSGAAVGSGRRVTGSARDFLDLLAEADLFHPGRPPRAGRARSGTAEAGAGVVDPAPGRHTAAARRRGATAAGSGAGDGHGTDTDPLATATKRLRQQRLGDTLVYLTGPGGRADLGLVGGLRGGYPSVVATVFGSAGESAPASSGLIVLDASDGVDFAAEWNGIRSW